MIKKSIIIALIFMAVSGITVKLQSQQAQISGSWDTNYGVITFSQTGNVVTGSYTGNDPGKLTGTLSGMTLYFKWIGENGAHGKGVFVFADDGGSFEGSWGYNDSDNDGGEWNGSRME